jgi:uncharacterized protein YcfJ
MMHGKGMRRVALKLNLVEQKLVNAALRENGDDYQSLPPAKKLRLKLRAARLERRVHTLKHKVLRKRLGLCHGGGLGLGSGRGCVGPPHGHRHGHRTATATTVVAGKALAAVIASSSNSRGSFARRSSRTRAPFATTNKAMRSLSSWTAAPSQPAS